MRALFARIGLITVGMAATEIGLAGGPGLAEVAASALVVFGLVVVVAGTAGFMVPLLSRTYIERMN